MRVNARSISYRFRSPLRARPSVMLSQETRQLFSRRKFPAESNQPTVLPTLSLSIMERETLRFQITVPQGVPITPRHSLENQREKKRREREKIEENSNRRIFFRWQGRAANAAEKSPLFARTTNLLNCLSNVSMEAWNKFCTGGKYTCQKENWVEMKFFFFSSLGKIHFVF